MTANAATGWWFSGWSGDLSGSSNPAFLTMDSVKTVTATFTELDEGLYAINDGPTMLGSSTTLTAVSDPEYSFYWWHFGDGSSGFGKEVTHTYAAPGTYIATVSAFTGSGVIEATTTVFVYTDRLFFPLIFR